MKKTILIFALSRSPWIGGIYYRKNIIHMMLNNKTITEKYNIVVLTNEKYRDVFSTFEPEIDIVTCKDGTGVVKALVSAMKCCMKYKTKYVFPIKPFVFFRLFAITPVSWIADFQHCHYPDFFEQSEVDARNKDFKKMIAAKNPLVVSSRDAERDLHTYFGSRNNVYVVHFTSYIDEEIKNLNKVDNNEILKKYDLVNKNYIAVCNQFWQHKNHKVVLEAVRLLEKKNKTLPYHFVFTGEPSDRRNPEYIKEIKSLLNDPSIKDHVSVLGFIDRLDQLCIMKHSRFIIQPSLFEGWGTVVEDAKQLGKPVLLSDIPVHQEQRNDYCTLFDPHDPEKLASLIEKMMNSPETFQKPVDSTVEYAKVLAEIFK